jgi:hypothetical protein
MLFERASQDPCRPRRRIREAAERPTSAELRARLATCAAVSPHARTSARCSRRAGTRTIVQKCLRPSPHSPQLVGAGSPAKRPAIQAAAALATSRATKACPTPGKRTKSTLLPFRQRRSRYASVTEARTSPSADPCARKTGISRASIPGEFSSRSRRQGSRSARLSTRRKLFSSACVGPRRVRTSNHRSMQRFAR